MKSRATWNVPSVVSRRAVESCREKVEEVARDTGNGLICMNVYYRGDVVGARFRGTHQIDRRVSFEWRSRFDEDDGG